MAFTNLATKLILNNQQTGSGPLGDGFVYLKFAWEVEMFLGDEDGPAGEVMGLRSTGPMIAKTCELPRFSVETQIVNVYNHKTIVQTRMNYEPITLSLYDQINGTAEKLIWDFVKGQFDPIDGSKSPGRLPLNVKITQKNLSGAAGAVDKVYTLTNVYIVDAQHDTLEYTTSDPVLWTLTLRYENLETADFAGPTPSDGGVGIPASPRPPKPPATPPTAPPKADAKVETAGPSKWVQAGGTETAGGELGAATGNPGMANQTRLGNTNIRPGSLRDRAAQANAARAAGEKPAQTTAWPESKPAATSYSPSTGTATKDILTPPPRVRPPSKELAATNQQFIKQEAEYVKDDKGMNPEYKKAYLAGLEKYPPLSKSLDSQENSRQMAETEALSKAPRYASQTRTQNADGSMTDKRSSAPTSVNNNATAASTQASREQQYVKKTTKPTDY